MANNKDTNRALELAQIIQMHQDLYYNADAKISDAEYDALCEELRNIDPDNLVLQKIGKDSADGFEKTKHILPMGSQSKAADSDEFLAWANKVKLSEYIVEYKLDGASLELQYVNGKLSKAVTRGDGIYGDDITQNAIKMNGVIDNLNIDFTGAIRAEVVMTKEIHKKYFADKANCRNAANGIMKRKDGSGSEHLNVICYDIAPLYLYTEALPNITEADKLYLDELKKIDALNKMGFTTAETKCFNTAFEVIDYRAQVSEYRITLPYDIDGLVVKARSVDIDDMKRARPERQIAFKFPLEEAVTKLTAIEWSESGSNYTPVGILEPVRLAGTTVKRASLSNVGIMRGMGLKIGSKVIIVKRGEIIPKIEGIIENPRDASEIKIPSTCSCGAKLEDDGTRITCPNPECPKKDFHRLEKWLASLDIMEVGITILTRLFESVRVKKIADLYTLSTEELSNYERMGEASAAKIINNINAKKEVDLQAFIAGLDIDGIGKLTIEKAIQKGFNTIEKLQNASIEELASIDGFGEITAAALHTGLKKLKPEIDAILQFVTIKSFNINTNAKLYGISFCFTGELTSMKRNAAAAIISEQGGTVKNSVVKGLSYLVTNDPSSGSEKNKKAIALGINIIDEKTFLDMIK